MPHANSEEKADKRDRQDKRDQKAFGALRLWGNACGLLGTIGLLIGPFIHMDVAILGALLIVVCLLCAVCRELMLIRIAAFHIGENQDRE